MSTTTAQRIALDAYRAESANSLGALEQDAADERLLAALGAPVDDEWENPHLADAPGYQDFAPQYR